MEKSGETPEKSLDKSHKDPSKLQDKPETSESKRKKEKKPVDMNASKIETKIEKKSRSYWKKWENFKTELQKLINAKFNGKFPNGKMLRNTGYSGLENAIQSKIERLIGRFASGMIKNLQKGGSSNLNPDYKLGFQLSSRVWVRNLLKHSALSIKDYRNILDPFIIQHFHQQWKHHWLNEFLSDLFALYTLGPAYAHSHVYLVTQTSKNIYDLSLILPQSHLSDEARTKMLLIGLNLLGFKEQAEQINEIWNKMPFANTLKPKIEYIYAYPHTLLEKIAELFLEALSRNQINIITLNSTYQNNSTLVKLLNDTWKNFWENPNKFRNWEDNTIRELIHRLLESSNHTA